MAKNTDTETLLSEYTIAYDTNKTTITAKNVDEIYKFTNGKLSSYTEVFDGKVVQAEKYSYTPYKDKHIERAKKNTLNKSTLSSFVYTKGEAVDIVLNDYNLPLKKTVTGLSENAGVVRAIVTQYKYNADNLCIMTQTVTFKVNESGPYIMTISNDIIFIEYSNRIACSNRVKQRCVLWLQRLDKRHNRQQSHKN